MSKYRNYSAFLDEHFTVLSSVDEFKESKEIRFQCKAAGHVNILKATSFGNKKAANPDAATWCEGCKKTTIEAKETQDFGEEVKHLGHTIVAVTGGKFVRYRCGNCDRENTSTKANLRRAGTTRFCNHCQNEPRRLTYDELCRIVEAHGMQLLSSADEYRNNKQKLRVRCVCGNDQHEATLADVRDGKHCRGSCRARKYEETCMERYGVRNVSQHPEIFEKIQEASSKPFIFPSGRRVTVHGWEPLALKVILETFSEDDICVSATRGVPQFKYTLEGVDHVYFPDFYLRSVDTVVEVKTLYTFDRDCYLNLIKFNAVTRAGYGLKIMVYDAQAVLRVFDFVPEQEIPDHFLTAERKDMYWQQ
jgi:hypothetical protein